MDNSFNLSELAVNTINAIKGLNKEQLMTVGFVAWLFTMYKSSTNQISDNSDCLSPDDVIDVAEVCD